MATNNTCADDDMEIVEVTPNDDKDSSSEDDDDSYDRIKDLVKPLRWCKKTNKILKPKKPAGGAFESDSEE